MMKADELGELVAAGWATLAADLLDVPSALLALLLVRHLTKLQEQALLARSHNQTFGADSADAARPSTFE
jgi:hypothetical protein